MPDKIAISRLYIVDTGIRVWTNDFNETLTLFIFSIRNSMQELYWIELPDIMRGFQFLMDHKRSVIHGVSDFHIREWNQDICFPDNYDIHYGLMIFLLTSSRQIIRNESESKYDIRPSEAHVSHVGLQKSTPILQPSIVNRFMNNHSYYPFCRWAVSSHITTKSRSILRYAKRNEREATFIVIGVWLKWGARRYQYPSSRTAIHVL